MNKEPKSNCCSEDVFVPEGNRGTTTHFFVCKKCKNACDAILDIPQNAVRLGDKGRINHIVPTDKMVEINTRFVEKGEYHELKEKLAAIEHDRWSEWQKYVHSKLIPNDKAELVLPTIIVERWNSQINTPYSKLSEKEKDSDREQVERYWPLIQSLLTQTLHEALEEIVEKVKVLKGAKFAHFNEEYSEGYENALSDVIVILQLQLSAGNEK